MTTITIRAAAQVTDDYSDITAGLPGSGGVPGLLRNYGPTELEVVKGGDAKPAKLLRGAPIPAYGNDPTEADHIWVKCRAAGATAVVGFEIISSAAIPPTPQLAFGSAAMSGLVGLLLEDI